VTVCVTAAEVLALKLLLPLYAAVIECTPAANVLLENVATPLNSGAVPNVIAPSAKVTVPIGVPHPEVTVAVNTTVLPATAGLGATSSPLA